MIRGGLPRNISSRNMARGRACHAAFRPFIPFVAVSFCAGWEPPITQAGRSWMFRDPSVHRFLADHSVFAGHQREHRVQAALPPEGPH